jgi:hypothetical protein
MTWFIFKFALWYAAIFAYLGWLLSDGARKNLPRELWVLFLAMIPLLLFSTTVALITRWPP